MSVQEIEQAVSSLSDNDLSAFRRWFFEFDSEAWRAADAELERLLVDRLAGPFDLLEDDWKQRVRQSAARLSEG